MPIKRGMAVALTACLLGALLLGPAAVQPAHAQEAEPAQATPTGATDTARPAASANSLIVSARQAWNLAQEAEGEARQAALRAALDHLQAVLRQHIVAVVIFRSRSGQPAALGVPYHRA